MHLAPLAGVALFSLLPPVTRALHNITSQLLSPHLGLSSGTEIFLAGGNYTNETTQRWTIHDAPTYIASVKPAQERDVQILVRFASANNIPFLATGAGHGFATTFGELRNGIEIDLGFFRDVSVNANANTMTIGGGVRFGDVFAPLYNAGKEITTGTSSCVGMLGATLGGGVGRYNGIHGMILDSLLSVTVVTASGDIVTASTTENADLFWAIRGAGFNYGIVVSATYRIYDLTSTYVMNADLIYAANDSSAIMNYLKSFGEQIPVKFSVIILVRYAEQYGGLYFIVNAVYAGSVKEGQALLQPLIDASSPLVQNVTSVPWKDLTYTAFFSAEPSPAACVKGLNRNVYGGSIKSYDIPSFQEFFDDMATFYKTYPNAQSSVFFIEHFSKEAVLAVNDKDTAYPHREITSHLLWNFGYTDISLEDTVNAFARQSRSTLSAKSGFDGLQIYVTYGHGDEGSVPLYGERKLPRLRVLKKLWDPRNLFRFNEPLY